MVSQSNRVRAPRWMARGLLLILPLSAACAMRDADPPLSGLTTADSVATTAAASHPQRPAAPAPRRAVVVSAPVSVPRSAGAERPGAGAAPRGSVPTGADTHGSAGAVAEADSASGAPGDSGAARRKYLAGEDPAYARGMGWPVAMPEALPGSILPRERIVAYYGNPLSTRMGILGELPPEEMLKRLDAEVARWRKADPATRVRPALQLIAVVAQGDAGTSGKYRTRMRDSLIEQVSRWADSRDALVFLDVQVGTGTLREELPRLREFLKRPNFHLAIDPEFSMKDGTPPGRRIGTMDASDVNYAVSLLGQLVDEYDLPPKVLVVHRFTRPMLTHASAIRLDPRVQIVINMDGWGAPWLKRASYRDYIVQEPVQFTGFKLFYHNDTKKGDPLLTPEQVLRLFPRPVYIQYQ